MIKPNNYEMEIINLTQNYPSIVRTYTSFACNLKQLKEVWIFNCCQGCQHLLGKKKLN